MKIVRIPGAKLEGKMRISKAVNTKKWKIPGGHDKIEWKSFKKN